MVGAFRRAGSRGDPQSLGFEFGDRGDVMVGAFRRAGSRGDPQSLGFEFGDRGDVARVQGGRTAIRWRSRSPPNWNLLLAQAARVQGGRTAIRWRSRSPPNWNLLLAQAARVQGGATGGAAGRRRRAGVRTAGGRAALRLRPATGGAAGRRRRAGVRTAGGRAALRLRPATGGAAVWQHRWCSRCWPPVSPAGCSVGWPTSGSLAAPLVLTVLATGIAGWMFGWLADVRQSGSTAVTGWRIPISNCRWQSERKGQNARLAAPAHRVAYPDFQLSLAIGKEGAERPAGCPGSPGGVSSWLPRSVTTPMRCGARWCLGYAQLMRGELAAAIGDHSNALWCPLVSRLRPADAGGAGCRDPGRAEMCGGSGAFVRRPRVWRMVPPTRSGTRRDVRRIGRVRSAAPRVANGPSDEIRDAPRCKVIAQFFATHGRRLGAGFDRPVASAGQQGHCPVLRYPRPPTRCWL